MIPLSQVLADLGARDGMTVRADEIERFARDLQAKLDLFVSHEVKRCVHMRRHKRAAVPELGFHDPVVTIEGTVLRISAADGPPSIPGA